MLQRRPFHEAWIWFTILLLATGYIAAVPGLVTIGGALGVVLGMAWWWDRRSLQGVKYRRLLHYRRGFKGEEIEAQILVENRKLLPLVWLHLADNWPADVVPAGQLEASHRPERGLLHLVLSMRGYARTVRQLQLFLRARGVHRIGPVEATSGDPFGLFLSRSKDVGSDDSLVVFPELRSLGELGVQPDDPFGEQPTRRRLFEDVNRPMGVREHQPEDGFRRIHWPATAATGELQTRLFQPVRGLDLVVCLNASTFAHHWEGTDPEKLEALIEASASLIMEGYEQGYRVGLISNGSIAHAGRAFRLPPGRSKGHLPHLLEALAGVTPLVTAPFHRYLLSEAPRLEYGSILVVVTAVVPPELQETLLRLRGRNRKTLLVYLSDEPPPDLEGIETHQLKWSQIRDRGRVRA